MIASFTWQDSSPRPTRQGVAFNRPLINYPDSIRLHHANHLHASLYARIRATKSERKAEKESPWNLIARTSHYLFARDLRYRSQRAVESREYFFFFGKLKISRFKVSRLQCAIEPRIEKLYIFLNFAIQSKSFATRRYFFFENWKFRDLR